MTTQNQLPTMYSTDLLLAAGINPKTGLPIKEGEVDCGFKPYNKKILRIMDEQTAVNRYVWRNLPDGLNSRLIERILYYRGQGAFFYMKENGKFYFLPYTLHSPDNGTGLDVYGRYTGITPLPFNGTSTMESDKKDKEQPWIPGLHKKPVYDIKIDEVTLDDFDNSCVLIKDYSEQISQHVLSRQVLNDPLLDVMSDCIPFMRTALLNSTGVQGMRVQTEPESAQVYVASKSIDNAALTGKKWIPIVGGVDFQEFSNGTIAKAEDFLLAMQSLDNYRLSTYGLNNGGLFEKKDQILNAEMAMNATHDSLILQDGLKYRQDCADIINSIWGLNVICEISESLIGADLDGNGVAYESKNDFINENEGGNDNVSE